MVKLCEYKRDNNISILKLFGITLYQKTTDYKTTMRTQKFLGGLISTCKIADKDGYRTEKNIKFCGIPLIKRIDEPEKISWYLWKLKYKETSLQKIFIKKYFQYFSPENDDIYILNANSGEIYLFLTYIFDALRKKNGSKNPLFIATKKYHTELVKMIHPDVSCVYIPHFYRKIESKTFTAKNYRFFTVFPQNYFANVEHIIKTNPINSKHYFNFIMEQFDIKPEEIELKHITVPNESENKMLKKIKKINLNLDNFIFLSPEAASCELLDNSFWIKLIKGFQDKGYDVFINIVNNIPEFENFKSCYLTYSEAFALAQKAKRIISLRSGFTEFLLQTNVPMDVIYTKFKDRHLFRDMGIDYVTAGFSISKLPFINNNLINEIVIKDKNYEDICSNKILEKL